MTGPKLKSKAAPVPGRWLHCRGLGGRGVSPSGLARGPGAGSFISSVLGLEPPASPTCLELFPVPVCTSGRTRPGWAAPVLAHGQAVAAQRPARWPSPGEAGVHLGALWGSCLDHLENKMSVSPFKTLGRKTRQEGMDSDWSSA